MRKLDHRKLVVLLLAIVAIVVVSIVFISDRHEYLLDVVKEKYQLISDPHGDQPVQGQPQGAKGLPKGATGGLGAPTQVARLSDVKAGEHVVVFPKQFPLGDEKLASFYHEELKSLGSPALVRFHNNVDTHSHANEFSTLVDDDFHAHKFDIFTGFKDGESCEAIGEKVSVEITALTNLDANLEKILRQFISSDSPLLREMQDYFKAEFEQQVKEKTLSKHWYRLAGTSVWLEEYGVHFMISRVIYSKHMARNQPAFSMTYVQIFNEKWQEMKNVELIVPTNDPDSIHSQVDIGGTFYNKVAYPNFLAIPCYQNPDKTDHKYYGPEDPRILLVMNEKGHQEPVIIYNSYHRKIVEKEEVDEHTDTLKFEYYRLMFMTFPWQFQRGKRNISELPNKNADRRIYNRAIELRRKGLKRMKVQKNWTPFIDFHERQIAGGYDRFIYFVYRWSNLEILKCELTDTIGSSSNCEFVYRMNEQLPSNEEVGALRGGTELININAFADMYGIKDLINLPDDKQILVGIARAHIKDCGCGQDIYRPNIVVLTKDDQTQDYKIDMVSSFVSLDVPTIGWNLDKPKEICVDGEPSVFIPNGISSWSATEVQDGFEDNMTLSFSLSDSTVDIIHIKNLLREIMARFKVTLTGYNNDNVDCAIRGSEQFCHDLGEQVRAKKGQKGQ